MSYAFLRWKKEPTVMKFENEPMLRGMVKIQPLRERFLLTEDDENQIRSIPYQFGFGGFSETVYYRTYSQLLPNGKKEKFPDTVVRVINGVMSIRKNWYIQHGITWNEDYWKSIAIKMGTFMMKLKMLPPGRGLWICGTNYMYEKGASSLNNCGFISTKSDLITALTWLGDNLMKGCGIGFDTIWKGDLYLPGCIQCRFQSKCEEKFKKAYTCTADQNECNCDTITYIVHDSREGWMHSIQTLLDSYFLKNGKAIHFDYREIREKGAPIKGFGGISSGYVALETLHNEIRSFIECFIESKIIGIHQASINMCTRRNQHDIIPKLIQIDHIYQYLKNEISILSEEELKLLGTDTNIQNWTKTYNESRLITDLCNAIGVCIISANVRRSAEIALGEAGNIEFLNLKNYKLNPERASIGWMSNNTVMFQKTEDFEYLPSLAKRIDDNGEPGILNLINVERYGRVGNYSPIGREGEKDKAIGINPCGEIPLESGEMCCLVDVFSNRCETFKELEEACELATIYASTISLYQTDWSITNSVVGRNHRIGVSFCSIADYHDKHGFTKLTKDLKTLYKIVRKVNSELAAEAGVRESIRVTTIKPNGTTALLEGGSSGAHFPCFRRAIRRVRIASDSELVPILHKGCYTSEPDVYSGPNTLVFSFPIDQTSGGTTRPATEVTLWEQASLEAILCAMWADNSVSQTLYFNLKESPMLENVLAQTIRLVKSFSMLKHTPAGVYPQSPYEEIDEKTFNELISKIKPLDFSSFSDQAVMTRGCDGDVCEMAAYKAQSKIKREETNNENEPNKKARI